MPEKLGDETRPGQADVLQTIIDFLPSGVTLFAPDLQMIACNEQFKRLLDFPAAMFEGGLPSMYDLAIFNARRGDYGPGDQEVLAQQVLERARSMQAHVFERTRPNGTVLEIRGAPLPDGRGFVTAYTDITERIRNEKLIREVKNLMGDAINFSPTFIRETDREGNFTFLQGIEKILGYSGNELLGRTRHECFGHDAETIRALCAKMEARLPFDQYVIAGRKPSGELVWLSSSAQAVSDERGEFIGYRGVDADITELTRARQELEQMALHDALTGLANRRKFQLRGKICAGQWRACRFARRGSPARCASPSALARPRRARRWNCRSTP